MKHPDEEQLMAWVDGERDGIESVGAHLDACTVCQRKARSLGQLTMAVQTHSHDVMERTAGDDAWIEQLVARAQTQPRVVSSNRDSGVRSTVRATGWRRWQPVMIAGAIAAAAAGIFMVTGQSKNTSRGTPVARETTPATNPEGTPTVTSPVVTNVATVATTVKTSDPIAPSKTSPGSTLLSVESGQENTTVSVFDVESDKPGSTVAVVWISEE